MSIPNATSATDSDFNSNCWIDPFESSWTNGRRPSLESAVADLSLGSPQRRRVLEQLIPIDLEHRWRLAAQSSTATSARAADRPPRIQDYLTHFPELNPADESWLISLAIEEFTLRRRYDDEPPDMSEYAARFSDIWDRLGPRLDSARQPAPHGYEIFGEIGRGGMGIVYKARDLALNRIVALKMIRSGLPVTATERSRFRAEAEATARLQHPNIVQVFDVGEWSANGGTTVPYLAMEFVYGLSLHDYLISKGPPSFAQAADWIETLAQAVDYAHSQGVVHRDLKPANILFADARKSASAETDDRDSTSQPSDEAPVPKITDFGLAKRLDLGGQTRTGEVLGTPAYMAPEQAAGAKTVGPAADIYSLGAILYELLTGRPPFSGETPLETLRRAQFQEPARPSSVRRGVPRDLETVALKCLEKNPSSRYSSAAALADDLGRYRRGEVLRARPVGRLGRTIRWCGRYPLVAVLFCVVTIALVGVSILAVTSYRYAREATLRQAQAEDNLYIADMRNIRLAWQEGEVNRIAALLDRHRPVAGATDRRGWEWHYWDRLANSARIVFRHDAVIQALAVRPDGRRIATASKEAIKFWDVQSGAELFTIDLHGEAIGSLEFSPDGHRLFGVGVNRTILAWDADRNLPPRVLGKMGGTGRLSVHPKGQLIIVQEFDIKGVIGVWDATTGQVVRAFSVSDTTHDYAIHPDGQLLASCDAVGVTVRDFNTGAVIWNSAIQASNPVYSKDGTRLAVTLERSVRILDAKTGKTLCDLPYAGLGKAFSPNGDQFISIAQERMLKIWNTVTGDDMFELRGHDGIVRGAAYMPDGLSIISAGMDGTARLWDACDPEIRLSEPKHRFERRWRVTFSPDGSELATGGDASFIHRWNVDTRRALPTLAAPAKQTYALAYAPDGGLAAAGGSIAGGTEISDYDIHVWGNGSQHPQILHGSEKWVWTLAFSPDGQRLASAGSEKTIRLWDVGAGKTMQTLDGFGGRVRSVVYRPDGLRLAAACADKLIRIFDCTDINRATLLHTIEGHQDEVSGVAYSRDGNLLASCSYDHSVRLWDVSGRLPVLVRTLNGHNHEVWSVAFHPDGKRLATCGRDGTTRLWDVNLGEELLAIRERYSIRPFHVVFSPDGGLLAIAGSNGLVRLLDGRPRNGEQ